MTAIDSFRSAIFASVYWQSPQRLPLAAIGLIVIAASTVVLYVPQVRSIASSWRWVMPSLRLGALLALVVSVLQPVVSRSKNASELGAVLILIDNSRSMGLADTGRTPAQWVALASALGRLPEGAREARTASLQADADRLTLIEEALDRVRNELDYARLAGRGIAVAAGRVDREIDQLRSAARSAAAKAVALPDPALRQTLEELMRPAGSNRDAWLDGVRTRIPEAIARIEQSRIAADDQLFRDDPAVNDTCSELARSSRLALALAAVIGSHGVIEQLGGDVPVLAFAVSDRIVPVAVRTGQSGLPVELLSAEGTSSNLTGAVHTVLDRLHGTAVRAVVLLSDGHQVGGDSSVPTGLSAAGVPVYAVGTSPRSALKDVSVAHLSVPGSACTGEMILVRATLFAPGLPDASAQVTLDADGRRESRHLTFSGEQPLRVEFPHTVRGPGIEKLSLSVQPVAGEATTENNQVTRWIRSTPQRVRIAMLAGTAGWDFQYVRNTLGLAEWAQVTATVLPAGRDSFTLSPKDLLEQDVILLFDVPAASLSSSQIQALSQLISVRGGSVVIITSDSNILGQFAANPATAGWLPYSGTLPQARTWPGERPVARVAPSAFGARLEALRLGDDAESSERAWQQLPPLFRILPITPTRPGVRVLLVDSELNLPVLTEARAGAGRAFVLGLNETWRWRYKTGGRDHDRFWSQFVRYTTEEPYAVTEGGVSLDADAATTSPQQPIKVRARLLDRDGIPMRNVSLCRVRVLDGQRIVREQTMTGDRPGSGRFTANLIDLPEGNYQLVIHAGGDLPHPSIPLNVQRTLEAELADPAGDEEILRRLAQSSGGEFLRLDQVGALPPKLIESRPDTASAVQLDIWDSPYLYAFVLGCLSIEWALRKRFGLA